LTLKEAFEKRVQSIAKARGLDWTNILPNIQVLQPKDSKQQESHIEDACSVIKSSNSKVKLLIVDSIMFHYIAEYPGNDVDYSIVWLCQD